MSTQVGESGSSSSTRLEIVTGDETIRQIIAEKEEQASKPGSLPLVYDNSMLSTLAACPRKGFLSYLLHLKPRRMQEPLSFGSAIHMGLETYYRHSVAIKNMLEAGGEAAAAVEDDFDEKVKRLALEAYVNEIAKDRHMPRRIEDEEQYKPRSVERGFNLLNRYFQECPIDNELWCVEKPEWVELSFAILVGEFVFVGRIDLLVRDKRSGQLAIVDHKTTTALGINFGS